MTMITAPTLRLRASGEIVSGMFPGATRSTIRATVYGPLPTHGKTNVALVLHTTETRGMPRYNGGDTAPHYTFDARRLTWHEHASPTSGYVGTLNGHSTGGHGNCQALQVEIIAFSDSIAAAEVGGFWVGDFKDEQYAELARFFAWAQAYHRIGGSVYGPPLPNPWRAGADSPLRLSPDEWDAFTGLTAHGAVPLNTHWDTGVLDLDRIAREANVMIFEDYVKGVVEGWAEDTFGTWNRFARLFGETDLTVESPQELQAVLTEGTADGSETAYWWKKLDSPRDPEWPGMYARRELEFWAQSSEQGGY